MPGLEIEAGQAAGGHYRDFRPHVELALDLVEDLAAHRLAGFTVLVDLDGDEEIVHLPEFPDYPFQRAREENEEIHSYRLRLAENGCNPLSSVVWLLVSDKV